MLPMKTFCVFESNSPANLTEGDDSIKTLSEIKSTDACNKSHQEAGRRRRQRVNAYFSTLPSLLPNTTKSDKASLLAEVVYRVRELKRQIEDIGRGYSDGFCSNSEQELERSTWLFPGEYDEAALVMTDEVEIGPLKRALKDVVENRTSGLVQGARSKRARVFGSDNESGHGLWVGCA
ncbi:hypothetical protein PTKIN_Ptkin09bG0202800 [Pterospermum kingtungense]